MAVRWVTPQLCLVAAKSLAKIGLSFERNGNLFTVFYSKIKQEKKVFWGFLPKKRNHCRISAVIHVCLSG